MNKLEKVALRHAKATGKPLVLILNNVHYFNHDDAGRNMLLQLQQRAEAWAASGTSTTYHQTIAYNRHLFNRYPHDGFQLVGVTDPRRGLDVCAIS